MLYFGLYVQLRRGSVAGYTTDESWAYRPKESAETFESITFFINSYMRLILNTYLIKEMQAVSFSIRLRISSKRDNAYLFGRGFSLGGSLYLDGFLFCRGSILPFVFV